MALHHGPERPRTAAGLRGERRVALTGTPVENRLLELWALLQLLNPGLLGSLAQFRQRFAVPIERDHNEEATERLRRPTAPFLLRRLKSDLAERVVGSGEQDLSQLSTEELRELIRAMKAALAEQWWSRRFTTVLESYGLGARMERGRRDARGGRVGELTVKAGRLLKGEVPQDLAEAFAEVGVALFPHRWGDLQVRSGCPDDAVPCKHIEDPWLLLAWLGKDREALLATLPRDATQPIPSDLPPWWPVGLRARPEPLWHPPDLLPPDLPARLADLYRQLLAAGDSQDGESEG